MVSQRFLICFGFGILIKDYDCGVSHPADSGGGQVSKGERPAAVPHWYNLLSEKQAD